ncbi:MAG: hypothetical protein JNM49_09600 [Flavobacteriales bacterium]|nr:hypothetical protein [Flavobacteriales bacterium]
MGRSVPLSQGEFEKWIGEVQYIIFDCHISSRNLLKLVSRPPDGLEWREISGFLDHLRTQYYFTLTTQLAKLFCDGRQDYRLQRLVARMRASFTSPFIRKRLEANALDERKSILPYCWNDKAAMASGLDHLEDIIAQHDDLIQFLKRTRDNHIAHTSASSSPSEIAPSPQQLTQLVALANQVYTDLRSGLGMAHVSFDTDHSWNIDPVFAGWKKLVELHSLKRDLFRIHRGGKGPVFMECSNETGRIQIRAMEA